MGDTLVGLIATSSLRPPDFIADHDRQVVGTRFGDVAVDVGMWGAARVAMVTRGGARHPLEPGRVNYRGIVSALRSVGARSVLSTCAVGSIRRHLAVGTLVNLDQFIDFTRHRPPTLYGDDGFCFADMTQPYCARLRTHMNDAARRVGAPMHDGGCYVGVDGPRFETAAEVRMYGILGGDVVGHTGSTEAVMAREAGLCYASVGIITNVAAGLGHDESVSIEGIGHTRQQHGASLEKVMADVLEAVSDAGPPDCGCPALLGKRQTASWYGDRPENG
ncbi:MTAP family purine nucleoside phosphorylase [Streptomyces sp. NPDC102441]|uniref:MTAP family purine nucleoside phosphorylase n=1 Tax=Streptomyces sp. NPDC102441 TaxID=3366176 RepID=UPI003803B97C